MISIIMGYLCRSSLTYRLMVRPSTNFWSLSGPALVMQTSSLATTSPRRREMWFRRFVANTTQMVQGLPILGHNTCATRHAARTRAIQCGFVVILLSPVLNAITMEREAVVAGTLMGVIPPGVSDVPLVPRFSSRHEHHLGSDAYVCGFDLICRGGRSSRAMAMRIVLVPNFLRLCF